MFTPSWEDVQHEFDFDGSWRDVYVLDADVTTWQHALDGLRAAAYKLQYSRFGDLITHPPDVASILRQPDSSSSLLVVDVGGVEINCHFFTQFEIEFDLDPRQVKGQEQLDALFAFMRCLSDASVKPVILTPENLPTQPIFSVVPGCEAAEHDPA